MNFLPILSAVLLLASACGNEQIMTYDAQYDAVRFTGISDSDPDYSAYSSNDNCAFYNYSFIDTPSADYYDFEIPVYLVGKAANRERKVNCTIDAEKTSAPKDSYEVLTASVPAGEVTGAIKIRIYNAEELSESAYTVRLHLTDSEELRTGPSNYLNGELSWHNSIPLPTNANHIRSYNMLIAGLSNFTSTSPTVLSPNGMKAIYGATGWDDWDDPSKHQIHNGSASYGYYKYLPRYTAIYTGELYKAYAKMVADYLEQYKADHDGNALLHDAGSLQGKPVQARTY